MLVKITDRISYIPSCDNPLSADVAIIKGDCKTYIFDVGNGADYVSEINAITGEKVIIISHFHPDHMANLQNIEDVPCYVGRNTFKYTRRGTIVDKGILIKDGAQLHIFQLPSSHAKGSLGLEINEEYAFVGDAIGPSIRPEGLLYDLYNVQLLAEEIRILKRLKASIIIQSHNMDHPISKAEIIERLEFIYAKRNGQNPFIEVEKKYD